jgi:hypothetical protein
MRPSGAISIAVGLEIPEIAVSVKPVGSVAARAESETINNEINVSSSRQESDQTMAAS